MNYEVWLHFRHQQTLKTVAQVLVFEHADRLRAEAVLGNAERDFQLTVAGVQGLFDYDTLVVPEMRRQVHDEQQLQFASPVNAAITALRKLAAFDDEWANRHLVRNGSYAAFDHPEIVQEVRAALAKMGITN